MRLIFILLLPFCIFSQDTPIPELDQDLPNDIKWVTQSSEYKTLCEQIYRSASLSIRNRVAKTKMVNNRSKI